MPFIALFGSVVDWEREKRGMEGWMEVMLAVEGLDFLAVEPFQDQPK